AHGRRRVRLLQAEHSANIGAPEQASDGVVHLPLRSLIGGGERALGVLVDQQRVLHVVPPWTGRELRTRREFSLTSSFLGFVASPQLAGQALTTPGAEPWANRNTVIAISFFRFGLPPVDERAVPKRTSSGPGLPGSLGPECCASGRSVSVQGSLVRL